MNYIVAMCREKLPNLKIGFNAECEHLWKHAQLGPAKLEEVERGEEMEGVFRRQGTLPIMPSVVEVQAIKIVRPDPFRNIRIGRPNDYVYFMTQPVKLARQVIELNSLTPTVFVPPIAQETYFHFWLSIY